MASKLFVFSRPIPAPFDKGPKTVKGVSSQYGDGTDAKLCATTVKAVIAYSNMEQGTILGGLGQVNGKSVAEYKSAAGNEYHLVAHDPTNGKLLAGVFDTGTESMAKYVVGKERDGAALLLALIPALENDSEFKSNLESFCEMHRLGFPDMPAATNALALLCDNAYRRVSDDTCAAHVKVSVDNAGNITSFSKNNLDAHTFEPQTVIVGDFSVLAQPGGAVPAYTPVTSIPHRDFAGQYRLNPGRVLNAKEQALVPEIQPWYILPDQIVCVCKHAQATTGKAAQMRNFALRGPAGTGKTKGAEAIAAGLDLPYVKYTCSANTEVYDFIGQVFPETEGVSTGDPALDAQRKELLAMGGITYGNVAKLLELPGLDDMDYDPAGVYLTVTGVTKPDATAQDCMAVILSLVTDKVRELCFVKPENASGGQTYTYVETDFIRALKYGWCCEIQEPTTIMQPGVLVGLNSLLEQSGSITLPTGEIIRRHPDAVIVITTNVSYEGCRGMNQSVLDRMNLVQDIGLPPEEIMVQRAMSVTGSEDDAMVALMVKAVIAMADHCRHNSIDDGAVGMRSLIDWVISADITGDPYTSALYTVVSKATADERDREALIVAGLEPFFTRARRAAA